MNTNNPLQLLQQGFHVTLGAATALAESLQDPQKRQENLAQLRLEFSQLTELWGQKGQLTEIEARAMLERLTQMANAQMNQATNSWSQQTPVNRGPTSTGNSSNNSSAVQSELEKLTAELARMRESLEQDRSN
jgi:polyhydroxyalkanoate synthesis regulator phasin